MFRRILLPVDLSDRHAAALKTAAELSYPGRGEVILLHVIETISGLDFEEERPFYQRLEAAARRDLQRLGQRLEERKVAWRMEIALGSRAQQEVRCARETGADLIVLTSPVPDGEHPMAGLGSLSFRVALAAPCPVLLVR
jgi:nucleotide-binding universal stress UspA family protein